MGLEQGTIDQMDSFLKEYSCPLQAVGSPEACLQALSTESGALALFVDLDAVTLDEHFFQLVHQANTECSAIVLSSRTFHPELKEAMRRNIFAVLHKPCSSQEIHICLQALLEVKNLLHQPDQEL